MASKGMNSGWLAYSRERYPVVVYLLLSSGYVLTGWAVTHTPLRAAPLLFGVLCFMTFFFTLRLMDELKDYKKDVIAHPERPLPRGVLTVEQARSGIGLCMALMILLAVAAGFLFSVSSGALWGLCTAYLWLMYKEFYVGPRLGDFALIYAITHQVINVPMVLFGACLFYADALDLPDIWPAGFLVLGAFFCYEVCRKLDPSAHPILRTYLGVYGRPRTILIVVAAAAVAAAAAWQLGTPLLFWALEAAVLLSFATPKEKYKLTETLATLGLLTHLLGLPILRAAGVFHA